jgi:hypothetical protein
MVIRVTGKMKSKFGQFFVIGKNDVGFDGM